MFYISHCFIIHISNFVWFYSTLTFCWPELSTDAIRDTSLFCTYHYQTSYLSLISPILLVEKRLSCGEISAFHVWQLWGNWKFLHMWRNFRCLHMTDVEKSEILHIWHVCDVENVTICKIFATIYALSCGAQKYICGEKMTNIGSVREYLKILVFLCRKSPLIPKLFICGKWIKPGFFQVFNAVRSFFCPRRFEIRDNESPSA